MQERIYSNLNSSDFWLEEIIQRCQEQFSLVELPVTLCGCPKCSTMCFPLSVGGCVALGVFRDFQGAFLLPDLKAARAFAMFDCHQASVQAQLRRLQQGWSSFSPGQQERLLGYGGTS